MRRILWLAPLAVLAIIAFPTLVFYSSAASASDPVLLGNQTVQSISDSSSYPASEAFGFTASTSGTAASASVYLTSTDGATVGLYAGSHNNPTTRLDTGSVTTNTAGWVTVPLNGGVQIISGRQYWIAVGANTGGQVTYRDAGNSGSNSDYSGSGFASAYSTIRNWTSNPISAYISDTTTTTTTTSSTTSDVSSGSSGGSVPCALSAAAASCWAGHTGVTGATGYTESQIEAGQGGFTHVTSDVRITQPNTVVDHKWISGASRSTAVRTTSRLQAR